MTCKYCDIPMTHKDASTFICLSCEHEEDQIPVAQKPYSNKGLLDGVEPGFMAESIQEMPKIAGVKFTNDAGEKLQSTEETLKERGNRYGEFKNHAYLSQAMKGLFDDHVREYGRPEEFTAVMSEAIEMIFHKLARIANGDPQYIDNFVDICGYSQLVVDELNAE